MASLASNLPDEIITAIATQLKASRSNADIRAFVLVSKRWHALGLRILYGNVALTSKPMDQFAGRFNPSVYANHIRSMTIWIEKPTGVHPNILSLPFFPSMTQDTPGLPGFSGMSFAAGGTGAAPPESLREKIAPLVDLLPKLQNLASFSLRLEEANYRSIPRRALRQLLESLPESCLNLELDTHGQDHREEKEEVHICDVLRRLLPQMHHMRLRLGAMCGAMFGTGNPESDDFTVTTVPNLRSLVVNCSLDSGQMQKCGPSDFSTGVKYFGWSGGLAWESVTAGLGRVVDTHGERMKRTHIYVTANVFSGDYDTGIRADMLAKVVWAIPAVRVSPPFTGKVKYLVRLPDESQFITATDDYATIVEGALWRTAVNGCRLPSEVLEAERKGLPSFAMGCCECPDSTEDVTEWAAKEASGVMPVRWRNEEKTKTRSLVAEKRTGDDYLELRPVIDIIPPGWSRNRNGELQPV